MLMAQRVLAAALWSLALAGAAGAQEKPPAASAAGNPALQQRAVQDVEPAVDTSASPEASQASAQSASAAPATAAAPGKVAPPGKGAARAAATEQGRPKAGAKDRIELDTTQITGNRELPKVLYIVPWKHSDLSDLGGRPANSLLDEVLTPVDRDVFQRENRYYGALQPDASRAAEHAPGAPAAAQAPPRAPDAAPARVEK